MRKYFDYFFTILLIILGVCHTSLTPVFFKIFDLNALWFAGTGMAFIFLGLINIFRLRTAELLIKSLCSLSNGLALIFCILIVLKLNQPQAFISLLTLIFLIVMSLIDLRLARR